MSEENKPALFQDNSAQLTAQNDAAAVARAIQEIQAALVIAQRFPRDEVKSLNKILQACKRKELAEVAEYEYSRGGTKITGPTIDLLRAIATRWGNIRCGWEEKSRSDGASSVRAFAWDLQTNTQAERTFQVRHWRDTQGGGYELKDERDIYELIANSAARRVRACLEEVVDSDIVNAAVDQCRLTLRTGEKEPLRDRAAKMVNAFSEFGVTQTQIETRLGNKLDSISENQLASLRRVFKSLKDGVGRREDYFKPETVAPNFAGVAQPEKAAPEPESQAPTPQAPAKSYSPNWLASVRLLCSGGKVGEGDLLGYLTHTQVTDGSHASLDEVPATVLKLVYEQWPKISEEIVVAKKGGAK